MGYEKELGDGNDCHCYERRVGKQVKLPAGDGSGWRASWSEMRQYYGKDRRRAVMTRRGSKMMRIWKMTSEWCVRRKEMRYSEEAKHP